MRIGIDARFLTHPQRGGFKTYTHSVVESLAQEDRDNEYILYIDRSAETITLPSNFKVEPIGGQAVVREQISLPSAMRRDGIDLAHYLNNTAAINPRCRMVVSMQDAIPLRDTAKFSGEQDFKHRMLARYWRAVMPLAARSASLIVTDSEFTKRDLQSILKLPEDKTHVVPLAVNEVFSPDAVGERPRDVQPGAQFLLAFASADGRKNEGTAIQAHRAVVHLFPSLKLVVVCAHPDVKARIADDSGDGVVALGPVSTDELIWLYLNAVALIFPSFDEGFGLPPIEAMACGTPVIASTGGSIPEITGGCALLAGPKDVLSFAQHIRTIVENEEIRNNLSAKGLVNAGKYTKEAVGKALIAAYEAAMERQKLHVKRT